MSLKEILGSGNLLATHFEFTNDPTEFRYGQTLVVDATRKTLNGLHQDNWAAPVLTSVLRKIETEGLHDDVPTFVACFSADEDNLGQWRAYADDGRGYALGFDTTKWDYKKPNDSRCGTVLVKCLYDVQAMAKEIGELHELILKEGALRKRLAQDPAQQALVLFDVEKALFLVGAFACLRLKHAGFQDEREWRLVALPNESNDEGPDCECVRVADGRFAPAMPLRLSPPDHALPFRRLVMGPYHAQEEGRSKIAAYGLRQLLKLKGHDVSKPGFIRNSQIPYRSRR
ncbi:MAG: DUF2971 domain-containing protein [Deltaproteobacteria bacterium]